MKDEKGHKDKKREIASKVIRDAAMAAMTKRKSLNGRYDLDTDDERPNKKLGQVGSKDQDGDIASFEAMVEEANSLKAQELQLRQQEIQLSRERYELDKAEREACFAVDQTDRATEQQERQARFALEKLEREQNIALAQRTLALLEKFNK